MTDEKAKVVIAPDTTDYKEARSASGSKTKHNNDEVAAALEGATVDEVKAVASAMGIEDVDKYDNLNQGQIRMNLGNRIRGAYNHMDKEKEGSGAAALNKAASSIRKAVDARAKEAEKAKAEKAKAEKAKAEKAKAA